MKRNFIMGLIGVLFVLIVSSYSFFFYSQQPMVQAEKEVSKIAEESADIQRVDNFYWYNGSDDTFFTVAGYTSEDRYLYVVVKQNGGEVTVLDSQQIVTEDEAKSILQTIKEPQKILEARLGMEADEPFWEVAYRDMDGKLGYVLLSANTGELMKEYKNI
ncbi:MAG TPA: DUF5590 domain-containing protein [Candidatus Jeotgalibaca pullicola]|nr:DUF5590 domain-containing protein [Candidatus Jeotgalibaca pullicola]